MTLRPYQETIVSSVAAAWHGQAPFVQPFRRPLVVSPTGSGKTVCFCHLARVEWQAGRRTLILVDQDELVWQALDKLKRTTGIDGQAEKAEHHASHLAPVVVATVQSMARRLEDWPANHFALVIADEADKSITPSWQSVLQYFNARVCGFTATPNRTDKKNLGTFYDVVAAEVGLFDLIADGYLSPITVKLLPITIDLSRVHQRDGDYDLNELDSVVAPHLKQVAEAIATHAMFRKTLVFLPLIRTSEAFVEIARSVGLDAEHIDGGSDDRKEKLARFSRGEFDVLANSQLLTRGYDDPAIDCVVPLRPTKSETLYTQIVGRGTRIAPGKRDLLLMDFLFQSTKHKLCRPANLIAADDLEAEIITKLTEAKAAMPGDVAEDLQTLAATAGTQREEALRKRLEETRGKKGKTISAEEFAFLHHKTAVADYEPTMAWESAKVTDRQAVYLKRAKIDLATVKDCGHASKLLDIYFSDVKKPKLASPKAVGLMRRLSHIAHSVGIHDFENVTTAQAGKFFAEMNRQKRQPEFV